tara:strand:+ start:116 stop:784 length:669 start_codon:yes stop_codon:yes gene_type:complete
MTITIYGLPFSTYTCTVMMTCIEKGAEFALDAGDISSIKQLKKSPHIDRHPFGKMPAIEDGTHVLYETSAICRYIDEKFDGPSLFPSTNSLDGTYQRAQVEQWISAASAYFDNCIIRQFVLQYVFPRGEDKEPDRAVIDKTIPIIRRNLEILNIQYGTRDTLVGDSITLADLFFAPILHYLSITGEGQELMRHAPNVQRGLDVMKERQSFKQAFPSASDTET